MLIFVLNHFNITRILLIENINNWYSTATHAKCDVLGPVHMSRASPANRADLNHENLYFSTT